MKTALAILSADWHYRGTIPRCRVDNNFFNTQFKKIAFILSLSTKYSIPIIVAGDLGNKPSWPNWLLREFILLTGVEFGVKYNIFVVAGQHDLPNHIFDFWNRAGIGVLAQAGCIKLVDEPTFVDDSFVIHPFSYGSKIRSNKHAALYTPELPSIAVAHQMVVKNKPAWQGQKNATSGISLLKKFPEYDCILTGDNHIPFTTKKDGRILVNAGAVMRTTVEQINHKPRVYIWYDDNTIEKIYIPIDPAEDCISIDHVFSQKEHDERVDKYIKVMQQDHKITVSYKTNLETHIEMNRTHFRTKEILHESIGV